MDMQLALSFALDQMFDEKGQPHKTSKLCMPFLQKIEDEFKKTQHASFPQV